MQTVHSPFHIKKWHEISFSQFQNYNQKQESKYQSPSIAVESIQKLVPSDLQEQFCMHSIHKKYLLRNEIKSWECQQDRTECDDQTLKENKTSNFNKITNTNHQYNKQAKNLTIQNARKSFIQNVYKTPQKQVQLNESQQKKEHVYFSNTSTIKDEQIQAVALKIRNKRSIYSINFTDQNSQFQQLSLSNYHLISQRYLNSSQNSHFSQEHIERQIFKLQKQIQKLNKIKKQMNKVQNQEYDQNSKKIVQTALSQQTTTLSKSKQNLSIQRQSQFLSLSLSKSSDTLVKSRIINIKQKCNEEDVKIPKLLSKSASKVKKTQNKQVFQIDQNKNQQIAPKSALSFKNLNVNTTTLSQKESQQLITNLQQQIKLDDSLRKSKKWFKKWKCAEKWTQLSSIIKSQNLSLTQTEMKTIFNLSSQQQNPFFTPKDEDFNLNKLIYDYILSQNHWKNYVMGNYTKQGLNSGSFIVQNLDISKRGQICIQDIVRYINYQLDATYRNRDIFLIFQRFSRGEQLCFETIIRCLTQKQC